MGLFKKFENRLVAPKADFNLQLDANYAALGESLNGALVVSPHEDIVAEEIRCEINCIETAQVLRMEYDPTIKRAVPRQVTETRVLFSAKPQCNPATQLINGVTKQFRFSINIPFGMRTTFQSVNDMVEWKIKGVIAVDDRPDVTTHEQSFVVILPSEKPVNQPPKVRLVACEYCKAAMPETVLECPNCGAHRTV